jgi:photosystem II stability/assembly factor-like uncharacterized protein
MASACSNLGMVAAQPCSKNVVAVVAAQNMWVTTDRGTSWQELGSGDGSAVVDNSATSIVFDPEYPEVFWETGLHTAASTVRTTDSGITFHEVGSLQNSQLISVDFSDPDRKTQLVGTHGGKQQLYLSTDGGQTFDNIGTNLGADLSYSESPIVVDAHTFLVGTQDPGAGTCGIYRSTDTGVTWAQQSDVCVNHYGGPLWASDGSMYWPLWNNGGMVKSTDFGVSWTKIVDENTIKGVTPRELPDGSILTLGNDHIVRTTDGGTTWSPIGEPVPFQIQGTSGSIAYSPALKTVFLSQRDCGNVVLSNAVMSAGFDWEN